MTTYTYKESDSNLRLESEDDGFFGLLLLDDNGSRLRLTDGTGGKVIPTFTKIPK